MSIEMQATNTKQPLLRLLMLQEGLEAFLKNVLNQSKKEHF
jgi:hypothetical protein